MKFYTTLFCVLSGENKIRKNEKKNKDKVFPFLILSHLDYDKPQTIILNGTKEVIHFLQLCSAERTKKYKQSLIT